MNNTSTTAINSGERIISNTNNNAVIILLICFICLISMFILLLMYWGYHFETERIYYENKLINIYYSLPGPTHWKPNRENKMQGGNLGLSQNTIEFMLKYISSERFDLLTNDIVDEKKIKMMSEILDEVV